jgi:uncharacterized delta-60 repeat protein
VRGRRQGFRERRSSSASVAPLSFALALLAALLLPTLAPAATPGGLDRSFGHDGWARTRFGADPEATAVATDSKNRVVVAGSTDDAHVFAIARYRSSGRLDYSFSGNGKRTTGFSGGPGYVVSYATSVAIDSRDRIVVAGTKCRWTAPPQQVDANLIGCEVALVRYKRNGRLDPSFGGDGRVTRDFENGGATSIAIDSRDRIVVAGVNFVARFSENGHLDPSFGYGGGQIWPTEECQEHDSCVLTSVATDSHRRIVAAGYHARRFYVLRFLPDGDLDPSFGSAGRAIGHEAAFALAVATNSKDQVLAAGGTPNRRGERGDLRLALYRPDGRPARQWGDSGEVTTTFHNRHHDRYSAEVDSVGFDSRGRAVAIGSMGRQYVLARYRRDGTLDRSFSGNGKATGPFKVPRKGDHAYVRAGTLDNGGRIVVAGYESDRSHFLLARFNGDRSR